MKIIHFDTDDLDNPLRGGQPVRTYEINSRLVDRHDISVFTSVYEGCHRTLERNGMTYRRLGFQFKPLGLSPHLSFLASMGPQLCRMPHDLVVEEFTPPVGFCLLPFWTSKPVVSIVQWYMFEMWEEKYHLPFSRWMRFLAQKNWYKYFIVQTDALGRIVEELVPSAMIRKIPCGVNADAFMEVESAGDFVLFLGRLDIVHKGLDLLIRAWEEICAPSGVPLLIAGEGEDRKSLEEQVRQLNLDQVIRFIGRVEGDQKRQLLKNCRILAMPSRYETFGIVALEAMAAGKPVVTFDIPHLNELVRPAWGKVVKSFDSVEFGKNIRDLWNAPEACRTLGDSGRIEALNYMWDRLALQQELFYEEVVRYEQKN